MKTYRDSIPRTQNTKIRLLTPFGIVPLVKWATFPGIFGLLMAGFGFLLEISWLKMLGLVLAAPLCLAYWLYLFVFVPSWVLEKNREARGRAR